MLHSLKLTAKVLKIGRPQKGTYYSNHWFSGGMLVSGGCLPCNTCDTFCVDPYALRMVIHPDETTKHDSFFMGQPMQVFVVSPLGHFLNSVKVDESFWSYELCWHVEGIFCTWFPLYSDYFFLSNTPTPICLNLHSFTFSQGKIPRKIHLPSGMGGSFSVAWNQYELVHPRKLI